MGCGVSKLNDESKVTTTRRLVLTQNNNVVKTSDNTENGYILKNGIANNRNSKRQKLIKPRLSSIEERSLEKQKISPIPIQAKAIQTETESIFGYKSQYTQTEFDFLPDDEFEFFNNEIADLTIERSGDSQTLLAPLSPNYELSSNNAFIRTENIIGKGSMRAQVTIDVGIQVVWEKATSSTQTKLAIAKSKFLTRFDNFTQIENVKQPASFAFKLHDFESQTDPLIAARAANGAGNDLNILQTYDNISSPFSHIEKELSINAVEAKKKNFDVRLQEALNKLLDDMEDSFVAQKSVVKRKDANIQTDNDPITDEAPEYAARPPPTRKKEMIPSVTIFKDVDKIVLETPEEETKSLKTLVKYLCDSVPNDLFKVRAIFRWIAENIKYDWKCMDISLSSNQILQVREGVCKDYCQLFSDMCQAAGLRVKKIQGFAKGYDYRPGHHFKPGEDIIHNWNAVYIFGAWRLVDTTWGTGYTDHSGKFQKKLNEHFFLTDPESLIWTHFPYDEVEANYERWQLLDKPVNLDDFNAMPKVTPYFFEFNLKIRTKYQNPLTFRVQTEIKIGAHETMRYKYKLYPADEVENSSLNHYVFCQLKEDRLVGSFICIPPIEGRYYLKIYAKPERHMQEKQTESSSLHSAITFLLECNRARKYIEPFPLNELPWGPTQSFYDYRMKLHNQIGPVVSTWGGKRRLCIESVEPMLITYQVMDSDGMEMDAKNLVLREDNGNKINFTISFPRVGMFKFSIFGMPKPKQKGKWRLPLLATFLIDCKLAKLPPQDEDPPPERISNAEITENSEKKKKK
ncbi:uncharacterized protein B4U79_08067 [Dinothrombium tinctorium]|uniref:Transglutaminase-like domain-containing protein n=1 Tax=Dinothrombium tinctorium TaxID=1965070 RepID=A0A3S3PR77_9ACAR|nr:uncharacterized protein B4U79_08067 [Dinothrombium tinctorium]